MYKNDADLLKDDNTVDSAELDLIGDDEDFEINAQGQRVPKRPTTT